MSTVEAEKRKFPGAGDGTSSDEGVVEKKQATASGAVLERILENRNSGSSDQASGISDSSSRGHGSSVQLPVPLSVGAAASHPVAVESAADSDGADKAAASSGPCAANSNAADTNAGGVPVTAGSSNTDGGGAKDHSALVPVPTPAAAAAPASASAPTSPTSMYEVSEPVTATVTVTQVLMCPHSRVSSVIGTRGQVVQEIARRSMCRVQVEPQPQGQGQGRGHVDSAGRRITIEGLPEAVAFAAELCRRVMEDGPTAVQHPGLLAGGPVESASMRCPEDRVRVVIGAKGGVISELSRRSGCRIQIDQHSMGPTEPRIVNFSGRRVQVLEGQALVAAVIAQGAAALGPISSVGPLHPVPLTSPFAVAGAGATPGVGSGAWPAPQPDPRNMTPYSRPPPPPPPPGPHHVRGFGPPGSAPPPPPPHAPHMPRGPTSAGAGGAGGNVMVSEMEVAHDKVAAIIGARGSVVSHVMRTSGCRVSILQDGLAHGQPRKAKLTGTAAQIGQAMMMILAVIASGPSAVLGSSATAPPSPGGHRGGEGGCEGDGEQGSNLPPLSLVPPQAQTVPVVQEVTMLQSQLADLRDASSGDFFRRLHLLTGITVQVAEAPGCRDQKVARFVGGRKQVQVCVNAVTRVFQQGISLDDALSTICSKLGISSPVASSSQAPVQLAGGEYGLGIASLHQSRQQLEQQNSYSGSGRGGGGGILALGSDGLAGYLYEAGGSPSGATEQVALVRRSICGRLVGKNGATLALLRAKAGCSITADKLPDARSGAASATDAEFSRVVLSGSARSVQVGAQMVQEVLSQGVNRIKELPDATADDTDVGPRRPDLPGAHSHAQTQHSSPRLAPSAAPHDHTQSSSLYTASPQHQQMPPHPHHLDTGFHYPPPPAAMFLPHSLPPHMMPPPPQQHQHYSYGPSAGNGHGHGHGSYGRGPGNFPTTYQMRPPGHEGEAYSGGPGGHARYVGSGGDMSVYPNIGRISISNHGSGAGGSGEGDGMQSGQAGQSVIHLAPSLP